MDPSQLTALILAGGQSQRMGTDKALLPLGGVPLIQNLGTLAQGCCGTVAVVTPWGDRYQPWLPAGCQLWPEAPAPWASNHRSSGPLWGFAQGLGRVTTPWVLLLACDLPRLNAATLQGWLPQLSHLPPNTLALLPPHPKGWDPLCGFYHRRCQESLGEFLRDGGRSFQPWLRHPPLLSHVAPLTVTDRSVLWNCNTPEDWQTLTAIDQEQHSPRS